MTLQQLLSYVRRACDDYAMIESNDRVAVAISGGKDSMALLTALAAMRRFYPKPYSLTAITVNIGFAGFDTSAVAAYCQSLDVPYTVRDTQIGSIVFEERKEKNPCSLCAKMRKAVLNEEALRLGCTRVAYGHNRDDLLHTFFMSLFFEGRLHVPEPVTFLDRTGLYTIRPLMYVPEREVIGYKKRARLPVAQSCCPADGHTQRAEMNALITQLRARYSHLDAKLFTALRPLIPLPPTPQAQSDVKEDM